MGVRIIVDSASDIALAFANQNNIAFVPLKTNLGGVEYRDGIDILPDVFFEKLEQNKELAHTSSFSIFINISNPLTNGKCRHIFP